MHFFTSAHKMLVTAAMLVVLNGCSSLRPDAHLAAFSTQMTGMNEVPAVNTAATGRVVAVLDKNTRLFRWQLSFTGLRGTATVGHFHGPAAIGSNAGIALTLPSPLTSPQEGRSTLTPAQAAALLAGKWYANVHSSAYPNGEIRGQLILRE